jgi:hypothetical protein
MFDKVGKCPSFYAICSIVIKINNSFVIVDVEFNCTTHHIEISYSLVVIMWSSSHICMCVRAPLLLLVVTRFILGFVLICIDSFLFSSFSHYCHA